MSSIISSFRNVTVALQQDQFALTATADNISNQNTAGYARRVVTWSSGDTVTLSGTVAVQPPSASVTAQRSSVLDRAVASSTASAASASTIKTALNALQSLFAIDSSGNEGSGINAAISGFFSAVQSVAADPTSPSARQSALAAAETVAARFQSTSSALAQQTADLNSTVQGAVDSVNQLTASIATLNGKISTASRVADRDALNDQRTAQIESLSQLVGLQQTTSNDGSVSLFTSSGGALVVGGMSKPLTTGAVAGALHVFAQGIDITTGLDGGTLGGALSVRDGALANTQSRIDALATDFAAAVNATNANGITAAATPGQPIFNVANSNPHAAAAISVAATTGDDFAAGGSGDGSGGNANANAMAALANQIQASGDTFAGALSAAISSIGVAAASAATSATRTQSALAQATASQGALSGISLDTEAANLTRYQRSFQAEAKLLAILNQIMADTINLGTNTAVS